MLKPLTSSLTFILICFVFNSISNATEISVTLPNDAAFILHGFLYVQLPGVVSVTKISESNVRDHSNYLGVDRRQQDSGKPDRLIIKASLYSQQADFSVTLQVKNSTTGAEVSREYQVKLYRITDVQIENGVVITASNFKPSFDWSEVVENIRKLVLNGGCCIRLLAVTQINNTVQVIFNIMPLGVYLPRTQQMDYLFKNKQQLTEMLTRYLDGPIKTMPSLCRLQTCKFCVNNISYIGQVETVTEHLLVSNSTGGLFMGLNIAWQSHCMSETLEEKGECRPGSCLNGGTCVNNFNSLGSGFHCQCRHIPNVQLGPRCEMTSRQFDNNNFIQDLYSVPSLNRFFVLSFDVAIATPDNPVHISVKTQLSSLEISLHSTSSCNLTFQNVNIIETFSFGNLEKWKTYNLVVTDKLLLLTSCIIESNACQNLVTRSLNLDSGFNHWLDGAILEINAVNNFKGCVRNVYVNNKIIDLQPGITSSTGIGCPLQGRRCGNHVECGERSVCNGDVLDSGAFSCNCHCFDGLRRDYSLISTPGRYKCRLDNDNYSSRLRTCKEDNWVINSYGPARIGWTMKPGSDLNIDRNSDAFDVRLRLQTLNQNAKLLELNLSSNPLTAAVLDFKIVNGLVIEDRLCKSNNSVLPPKQVNDGTLHSILIKIKNQLLFLSISIFVDSNLQFYCQTEKPSEFGVVVPSLHPPEGCISSIDIDSFSLTPGLNTNNQLNSPTLTADWSFSNPLPFTYTTALVPQVSGNVSFLRTCVNTIPDKTCASNENLITLWRSSECRCKIGFVRNLDTKLCELLACHHFKSVKCPNTSSCAMSERVPTCVCKDLTCKQPLCDCVKVVPPLVTGGSIPFWIIPLIVIAGCLLIFIPLVFLICFLKGRGQFSNSHTAADNEILQVTDGIHEFKNEDDEGVPPEDYKGSLDFIFPPLTTKTIPMIVGAPEKLHPVFADTNPGIPMFLPDLGDPIAGDMDCTLTYEFDQDVEEIDNVSGVSLVSSDEEDSVDFDFVQGWGPPFTQVMPYL